MRILVVEDEQDMNLLIQKVLKRSGYSVDGCFDGQEAEDYLAGTEYDVILLDVMLPKRDGYQLVADLRGKGVDTPVLFLTARDSIADRVKGLDLGADDYLVKPFDFDELLARIRVLSRKRVGHKSNQFTVADLTLDVERRQVYRAGQEIRLLPKEFSILECLMRGKGNVLSRRQIEDSIFWFAFSAVLLLLSIFPELAYWAAGTLGMQAPINVVYLGIIFLLILKVFFMTLRLSQMDSKLKALAQKVALNEEKIERQHQDR